MPHIGTGIFQPNKVDASLNFVSIENPREYKYLASGMLQKCAAVPGTKDASIKERLHTHNIATQDYDNMEKSLVSNLGSGAQCSTYSAGHLDRTQH